MSSVHISADLSAKAYKLAKAGADLMRRVERCSGRMSAEQFVEVADELQETHSRLLLLGGYFCGLVPVEEGAINQEAELEYMLASEEFIGAVNKLLGDGND
ncbi:hypothetical protein [Pseudomonas sp.]|uniref:hypothetical protein n=1 Tax=Pseudomonas sp. TaxID=306 RepID=UPI0029061150|nr:hypothetical protein [Pseudomonas sp.]MDU4254417.1 hypothetical protein [Pseudomonas sp.]